ncbi:hypothetical protein K8089_08265 [Aequorivita sp. F47161]|uniref:Trimeric autotransporter adhesin YadA-like head domain-containing protein n=1 Tax=Aequorivita vitellina TaxID=2874475 RepID=A0A9X1U9W7_9FLAO|nr:hypothetical protein [Aequorivita vitellina]MCG2419016.1 hypothetical protein [Aequorivita vitellina]
MKTIYISLFFITLSFSNFAQVGIGTTNPDPSSVLDITSSEKGMLLPRVNLTRTTSSSPINSPASSLLVYNTATTNDVSPGFYYWTGSLWSPIKNSGSGSTEGWSLTGNSIANNNFLGTTNYNSLEFKVNNKSMGNLHPQGGVSFGENAVATANNSLALGKSASASHEALAIGYNANSNGNQSVAIGYGAESAHQALVIGYNANNDGNQSVAIGYESKSAYQALAIGYQAQNNGNESVAIGSGAQSNYKNIAIGNDAKANANYAIALGSAAIASNQNTIVMGNNASASANDAIAIGNGATATQQNSTAIGNGSNTTSSNQIVLGSSSNTQVRSFGNLVVGGASPYTLPNVRGTDKQILQTDGAGNVTWKRNAADPIYGEIYRNSNTSVSSGDVIGFNILSLFKDVTIDNSKITILYKGVYRVTYTVSASGGNNPYFYLKDLTDEISGSRTYMDFQAQIQQATATRSIFVEFDVNDVISVVSGISTTILSGSSLSVELVELK